MTFKNSKNFERLFQILLFISTLYLLINTLIYSTIGFDFTDESFYINWLSNPSNYTWSISQFGFVYFPMFKLFKETL